LVNLCFHLAIHCKLRGYNELAAALYDRVWQEWIKLDGQPDPFLSLHGDAFSMWKERLWERASDRKAILKKLKALIAEDDRLKDWESIDFIDSLELTINFK